MKPEKILYERLDSLKTFLKSVQNQSLSSEICSGSSHEIGRSLQSFFSETGLENSREIPAKSAVFSANLSLKIPRNLTFFSATYQKPWLNDPQNGCNPCTRTVVYIYMYCRHIFSSFNCQPYCGCMAKTHAFLSSNKAAYFTVASQFVLLTYKKKMMLCSVSKLRGLSIRGKLHFN